MLPHCGEDASGLKHPLECWRPSDGKGHQEGYDLQKRKADILCTFGSILVASVTHNRLDVPRRKENDNS